MTTDGYLRINEIKNYLYCPRISYYLLCLHLDRTTDLSEGGIRSEQHVKRLMQRRKTALHAVHDGERQYDVTLVSHRHRLIGRIDEIVETARGVYLVDYKDTDQDYGYWQAQMTAYRFAAVEMGMTVRGCYIYTIPTKTYHEVNITGRVEKQVTAILAALHKMTQDEVMPPPVDHAGKCRSCQYQNFCGDVL
jgi:CRISPR-associated exonuclease Cas4